MRTVNEIEITIPGVPIAKKRPRFVRRGKFVGTYNCQDTEEGKFKWELLRAILPCREGEEPLFVSGEAVSLSITFYMPIPASTPKKKLAVLYWHTKKPDTDNLLKFVKDCGNGVLWADDSQVCQVKAWKMYGHTPRTEIIMSLIEAIS